MLVTRSGVVAYANSRLAELFDRPAEELVGADLRKFYTADETREQISARLERFDEPAEYEFHIPRADGTEVPVIATERRLAGGAPLCDHRVVTVIDISAQKDHEAQVRSEYEGIASLSDTVIDQAIALKHYSEKLEERVRERTADLHKANMDSIYMLAVASEAKDADTGAHVRRIQRYADAIARRLGLPAAEAERIGYSALLHDVGKIHVPDQILGKPGALTDDERAIMQEHTVAGEHILSNEPFFDVARQISRTHHENWDGTGYPDGLAGEEIPISARIVRIADVFDALTNQRCYKSAWPVARAVNFLREGRGRFFDTNVVDAFLDLQSTGTFETAPTRSR